MSQNRSAWIAWISLTAICFLAYFPAIQGEFFSDDYSLFLNNPRIQNEDGLAQIWQGGRDMDYWPLSYTSFWMTWRAFGDNPLPYHVTNIVLQGIAAFLLFRLLRKLQLPGAWLAAAIFAIHPLQVQTVAWIAELKNLQSGIFCFLSALLFWSHLENRKLLPYFLSLVLFAASVLSKSSTVVLPAVLLILVLWKVGQWSWNSQKKLVPFFLLSMISAYLTIHFQKHGAGAEGDFWELSGLQRIILAGQLPWVYLGKILLPIDLSFGYPKWELDVGSAWSYLPLLAWLAMGFLLWKFRRPATRASLSAFLVYLTLLFPVLGFFDIYFFLFSYCADHYVYLALIPCAALGSAALHRVIPNPKFLWATITILLLTLGTLTWKRSEVFQTGAKIHQDTLENFPESELSHLGLGIELHRTGSIEKAYEHVRESIRLNPRFINARIRLVQFLLVEDRKVEAEKELLTLLEIYPSSPYSNLQYGRLLLEKQEWDRAIQHLEQSGGYYATSAEFHRDLAKAYAGKGEQEHALSLYWKATQLAPESPEHRLDLGNALLQVGRKENARNQFEIGLQKAREQKKTELIASFEQALKDSK